VILKIGNKLINFNELEITILVGTITFLGRGDNSCFEKNHLALGLNQYSLTFWAIALPLSHPCWNLETWSDNLTWKGYFNWFA
jgi:hypothetical protein